MEPIMHPSKFYSGPILEDLPSETKLDLPFADNIPDIDTPPRTLSPREEIIKSPERTTAANISADLIRLITQFVKIKPVAPAKRMKRYTCCYRCGHTSHYANECFAIRNVYGKYIPTRARARVY